MSDRETLRRRRCVALQLAVVFGVLLPVFTRTWVSLVAGAVGGAVAGVAYWRDCRR